MSDMRKVALDEGTQSLITGARDTVRRLIGNGPPDTAEKMGEMLAGLLALEVTLDLALLRAGAEEPEEQSGVDNIVKVVQAMKAMGEGMDGTIH